MRGDVPMKIEQATSSGINELWEKVESGVIKTKCLEDAAKKLATELHTRFSDSVVIARVFFSVPFGSLPPKNKKFVDNLAHSAGGGFGIRETTPVLSLIGTHGIEADWNDRLKSKGHVGIPLISSAFVNAIPMISRLLKELGVPMAWVDSHDSEIIKKAVGGSAKLFYVENAVEATDQENRKIIVDQDFVSQYKVKGVFGMGDTYENGQMLVIVVFCSDVFPREVTELFIPLAGKFKTLTSSLVEESKIFRK